MKYKVSDFTLDEKLALLAGKTRGRTSDANGKISEVVMSDGPHGVGANLENPPTPCTAMPNLSALANSWDTDLVYKNAEVIADECIEKKVDVLLAPGINIKRTPLCGRNFEYFSEDPFLTGELGKAYIKGVQSRGVGTSLKHFALNNREYNRTLQSSDVDERTMREIYFPAFEIALQAKPTTVMCSYNLINGVYASENEKLLRKVLRDDFGFDGVIVSDWGAVHHAAKSVKASLDLAMPASDKYIPVLKQAMAEGWLTEKEIDERVEKILELVEKKELADKTKKVCFTKAERHERAVDIAQECIVLLKNEDNILPLSTGNIVVSDYAMTIPTIGGGGSAGVLTEYKPSWLEVQLQERLQNKKANVERVWNSLIKEGCYKADTLVLCVGTSKEMEREGFDRSSLRLPYEQEQFILNAASVNPNVVVVVYAGSAVDMSVWANKVKAIVWAGYLGEGAMEATANVLTGICNPSGKLAETLPLCLEDSPTGRERGNGQAELYREGILVGYRWYETMNKDVAFPFGYGLSYSQFEYSDLKIDKKTETDYEVSFTVKNTSNVDGKEISQLYVRDVFSSVLRPEKELKGFVKTALKAGESKRVSLMLNARSFAFYSTSLDKWYVENGDFEILIGVSSKDIRLSDKIVINLPCSEQTTRSFKY